MTESEIFKAAIRLPPNLRQIFLASACEGNQQLERDVKALLREFDEMGSFIDRPAVEDLTTDLCRPITESAGTTIGPYKLMEQIGEGGFGLVFVAEQQHPVRRKVALKIIKPGMDTREVIARFEAERQALALMEHPNIARVFDAGTTESGRPYFVMELVKGIPITDYCDQQHLTTRERLELFLSVCRAVQHAHTKGIIHRDIKPSNILVAPHDGVPVIKVIDFGVAKAIGQQLTDKTIYTRFTQMIGTPLYMSPEQAEINAIDVDTRSDVYSLGVLLYELLTGTTPIDRQRLDQAAYDEIRRIIREEEPPKPSTRLSSMGESLSSVSNCRNVEPSKLSALVKGDLDWIVMKALEKDRTRRYETATSFAADVRRFLAEEAIEARPPSSWYRFQKVARRNRAAIGTITLLTLSMLIGLAGTTWQAYRASQSERLALENEKKAIEERDARRVALEKEAEQRVMAETAQQKAQQERDAANLARGELRKSLYAASMGLIPTAWDASNVRRVRELLDEQIPKPGEEDLRHFEWDYWYRQSHGALRNWRLGTGPENFVISGGGTRIVGWTSMDDSPSQANQSIDSGTMVIRVLDMETEREIQSFRFHAKDLFLNELTQPTSRLGISKLSFDRDVRRIAVQFSLSTPNVPDTLTKRSSAEINPRTPRRVNHKTVVLDTQVQKATFEKDIDSPWMAISPDGHRLFTCELVDSTAGIDHSSASTDRSGPKAKFKIWDLDLPNKAPVELIADDQVEHDLPTIEPKFSPDGSRLVMMTKPEHAESYSIQFWDAVTGQQQLNHSISKSRSTEGEWIELETAFSPDGKVLATIGYRVPQSFGADSNHAVRDVRLDLWDCKNPGDIPSLKIEGGISLGNKMMPRRFGMAFSPDGEKLLAWNEDENEGSLIGISSRSVLQKLKTLSNIGSMVFSPDGKRVTSVAGDNSEKGSSERMTNAMVEEWNIAPPDESKMVRSIRSPTGLVLWSPTRNRKASFVSRLARFPNQSEDAMKSGVLISDSNGKDVVRFKGHAFPVVSLIFSPDGLSIVSLAVGRHDETESILWETDTGNIRWSHKTGPREKVKSSSSFDPIPPDILNAFSAGFSPDGKWVALPAERGQRIVDSSDLKIHFIVDTQHKIYFTPDSRKLVSFHPSTETKAVSKPSELQAYEMKIWDIQTGHCLATKRLAPPEARVSPSPVGPIYRATFSPDSRLCIPVGSFSMGLPIDIYNLSNGEALVRIQLSIEQQRNDSNQIGLTRNVVFSPIGDRLLVLDGGLQGMVGIDQLVGVWELPSGKLLYRLDGNGFAVQAGVFSPDGKRLATASTHPDRGEVKIWDASNGREMLNLITQERFRAKSISFSPDGKRLTLLNVAFSPTDRSMTEHEIVWDVTHKD